MPIYKVKLIQNKKKYVVDNVPGLNGKYARKRALELAEKNWGESFRMAKAEIQMYDPTVQFYMEK